jgi:hypothetical protein
VVFPNEATLPASIPDYCAYPIAEFLKYVIELPDIKPGEIYQNLRERMDKIMVMTI